MARLHRRNFLPTVIVNLILWIIWGLIIIFLDPEKIVNCTFYIVHFNLHFNVVLFFLALTLSLTLTFALLLCNTRRGFLVSLFIISILLLKLFKFLHWWLMLILLVLTIGLELHFSAKRKKRDSDLAR